LAATHKVSGTPPLKSCQKTEKKKKQLNRFYKQVREFREGLKNVNYFQKNKFFRKLKVNHSKDWLLSVELYELAKNNGDLEDFAKDLKLYLGKTLKKKPKANS